MSEKYTEEISDLCRALRPFSHPTYRLLYYVQWRLQRLALLGIVDPWERTQSRAAHKESL